jgi:hypothetical protein
MRIRKQVYDLTLQDFEKWPVWEFALDEEGIEGQDEATVRPYTGGILDAGRGMLVVKATFTFSNGSTASGYLTPPPKGDASLGTIQPVVVTAAGQVPFWCGAVPPSEAQITDLYSTLGSERSRVFPAEFESCLPIRGRPIRGKIPGFVILEDWKTMKTRIVS